MIHANGLELLTGRVGTWKWIVTSDLKVCNRDFAGSPVVKTSPHNAGVADLIPGWGAKISHALGPKIQNIKQEQYCSKFKKDLKNDPHYKRNLKRS